MEVQTGQIRPFEKVARDISLLQQKHRATRDITDTL